MGEIRLLDHGTIDKIAAGEVVERPASVVKELVENAVDAGADAVTVEIREGGIEFIRVTDNGSGIAKDQIQRAFTRHATSKIRTAEDLSRISSLGFRGEALSSISAVSKVEMITKTKDSLTGVRCALEGAIQKGSQEIGAPEGTTILVRNLFFNTPARRKFLKSPVSEGGYITDLMEHMALANPNLSFKYMIHNKLKFHTKGDGDLKDVIYRIYGKDVAAQLVPVNGRAQGVLMSGYLGKPVITRANRSYENYFVNGRYIKSDLLSKALEEGYKTYLMQHKYPFAVIHFEIQSDLVDVNVHPAKMEVRFHDSAEIFRFVSSVVEETLREREMIPEIKLTPAEPARERSQEEKKVPEPFEGRRRSAARVEEETGYKVLLERTSPAKPAAEPNAEEEKTVQLDLFEEKMISPKSRESYKILGQIFDTYWLVDFSDKLFIVDQHAAHEKVKYEQFVKALRGRCVASQTLSPPVLITMTGQQERAYLEYAEYFSSLGFDVEQFGGREYAIRAVPSDLYGYREKEMFEEIIDEICSGSIRGNAAVIEEKLASMACKAAVKGNMQLSLPEIETLLDQLLELDNPYHCPHGRPTIISMTKYEIEKKFKRIL